MDSIPQDGLLGNLPTEELLSEMGAFLEPISTHLSEQRFRKTCRLAVQGYEGVSTGNHQKSCY